MNDGGYVLIVIFLGCIFRVERVEATLDFFRFWQLSAEKQGVKPQHIVLSGP